jgi:protein TonB
MKKLIIIILFFAPFLLFSQEETLELYNTIQNNDTLLIQQDTSKIEFYPEEEAYFQGGSAEMMKYINENLHYPKLEFETVPNGKIIVEFIVNIDGSLEQIKVLKGEPKEMDDTISELIKNMPNWIPAEQDGEIVRSRVRFPFNFKSY